MPTSSQHTHSPGLGPLLRSADDRAHPGNTQAAHDPDAQVALKHTIHEMVVVYRKTVADVERAFGILAAAEKHLNDTFTLGDWRNLRIEGPARSRLRFDEPSEAIKVLEREVWKTLVDRLEVRRLMSVAAAKKLDDELERGDLPPLTEDNAYAVLQGFLNEAPRMLAEAVGEVFEWLRPRRSTYKTNSEFEVGRKVILSRTVEPSWSGGFNVVYWQESHLTALENVFSALDGQGAINKAHYSLLSGAIKQSGAEGKGETTYFRFRCYGNGNLHLEFKRLDLVKQLNAAAGGKRLRRE